MDIKEYSKLIKAKRKELDGLMKRKMPVIAGRMAKDHFHQNFAPQKLGAQRETHLHGQRQYQRSAYNKGFLKRR